MDFLNGEIDPKVLPGAESITWQPVEKNYLHILRIQWLIATIVLFTAAALLVWFIPALRQRPATIFIITGCLLVAAFYFVLQERSFSKRAYAMREHDILYRHGWIIRVTEVCPFNRIQHCSVHSGPLERKYRLAALTLYTAASGPGDLKVSGLPETTAHNIREFIMKQIAANEGINH